MQVTYHGARNHRAGRRAQPLQKRRPIRVSMSLASAQPLWPAQTGPGPSTAATSPHAVRQRPVKQLTQAQRNEKSRQAQLHPHQCQRPGWHRWWARRAVHVDGKRADGRAGPAPGQAEKSEKSWALLSRQRRSGGTGRRCLQARTKALGCRAEMQNGTRRCRFQFFKPNRLLALIQQAQAAILFYSKLHPPRRFKHSTGRQCGVGGGARAHHGLDLSASSR